MIEITPFPVSFVLAGIEDLFELLIPIAFVAIYVVGGIVKSVAAKKEQDLRSQKSEKSSEKEDKKYQPLTSAPTESSRRVQRLPYARAASPSPPRKSALEKLEELKQQRLEQIRNAQVRAEQIRIQQQKQQQNIKMHSIHKPTAFPSRPAKPKPVHRAQQSIPVAKTIPVAQPVHSSAKRTITKMKTGIPNQTILQSAEPPAQQNIIQMLRNPVQVRHAIVAAEILGKPVSLR